MTYHLVYGIKFTAMHGPDRPGLGLWRTLEELSQP